MKKINLILLILVGLFAAVSCEKDETRAILGTYTSPAITAPSGGGAYTLTEATENDTLDTFSWSSADFGFQAAVSYTLQIEFAGNDFAEPIDLGNTNKLELKVVVGSLNNKLVLAGAVAGMANSIEARVRATINENVDTLYSAVLTFDVTPFEKVIIYPSVYVPGNYQAASGYTSDWSPDVAPQLYSLKDNDKYEGYVNMTNGSNEFKFTDLPDWTINWGDTGADGTLDSDGDNIILADAGYYKMNVDLTALTYTIMNTDWGLIGDATPGGWDSDQDLTYDPVNYVWTITLDLVAGSIKFRANDDWALNYGDDGPDLKLDAGGENIVIGEAGNYTITLDLSDAIYRYTVVKN